MISAHQSVFFFHFRHGENQLRSKNKIKDDKKKWKLNTLIKRLNYGKKPTVELKLIEFFLKMTKRSVPVKNDLLLNEANKIASELGDQGFKATNFWLDQLKKNTKLSIKKVSVKKTMLMLKLQKHGKKRCSKKF